jgi:hypothetical protein
MVSGCQRQKDIIQNRKKLLKKMLKAFLEYTLSRGQAITAKAPPHDEAHVVGQEGV